MIEVVVFVVATIAGNIALALEGRKEKEKHRQMNNYDPYPDYLASSSEHLITTDPIENYFDKHSIIPSIEDEVDNLVEQILERELDDLNNFDILDGFDNTNYQENITQDMLGDEIDNLDIDEDLEEDETDYPEYFE